MAEKQIPTNKKPISADWLVRGVLAKLGDLFDRFTGRDWKPSSSLATSELIERLKRLVDAEAKESEGRKFVPHNIKLKMQWDKFSIDSDEALRKLEVELLTALVDHINDRRYYTYAPLSLEVKPDYFTSGVKLHASFDNVDEEREVSIDVTAPQLNVEGLAESADVPARPSVKLLVHFDISGKFSEKEFELEAGERLTVGRTKENDLALDDASVSKMHAALSLKETGVLVVADTGSTNGTFINGERIPYGKAIEIAAGQEVRFGTVEVSISVAEFRNTENTAGEGAIADTEESIKVGDFEFTTRHEDETSKSEPAAPGFEDPEPTLISAGPASRILTPLTTDQAAAPKNGSENSRLKENEKN